MSNPYTIDMQDVFTPYAVELRARVYADGRDQVVDLDKKTSFAPSSVSFSVGATTEILDDDGGTKREVVSSVEIQIYGTMVYGEDHTRIARVNIRHQPNAVGGTTYVYTSAERLKNGRYVDMPQGAREKVANYIKSLLDDGGVTVTVDWARLADETQQAEWVHSRNRKATAVNDALEALDKFEAKRMAILPLAGSTR